MYKFLLILLSVVGMATATSAQQKQDMNSRQSNHKILVAYFSATGTTARAAQKVAHATGGELYAITPAVKIADTAFNIYYIAEDGRETLVEMNDPKARPAIKSQKGKIADYDVVFIGYPIWWGLAPRIVNTFIESHDLKGRTVIPFATSGGSGIANSVAELQKAYPGLNWQEGRLLNRTDEQTVRQWVEALGY